MDLSFSLPKSEWLFSLFKATISLFIIIDSIGNVPIIISLSSGMSEKKRRRMLSRASFASFFLLFFFAFLGDSFLKIFNISLSGFKVAGGVLLFIISIRILLKGSWEEEKIDPESSGIVPIAFPLLVGPGAITLSIVLVKEYGSFIAFLSILIVSVINYLILINMSWFYRVMGKTGAVVVSRLMSIFISALAVDFVVSGLQELISRDLTF